MILVTGAARGIGAAILERACDRGDIAVGADLHIDERDERMFGCDVTDRESVAEVVDHVLARHGRIDGLVVNAGVLRTAPFLEIDDEHWQSTIAVNLTGAFLTAQIAAAQMAPGSSIVFTSSLGAFMTAAEGAAYAASKAGVLGLMKAMSLALAERSIRVNAVAPGTVASEMMAGALSNPAFERMVALRTPLGRAALPVEIAETVMFLLSESASYITGQTLVVDGGRSVLNYLTRIESD